MHSVDEAKEMLTIKFSLRLKLIPEVLLRSILDSMVYATTDVFIYLERTG